jgi:catechol 2,3-dioxygenase-like lactoylglutathione lyase family enzyme
MGLFGAVPWQPEAFSGFQQVTQMGDITNPRWLYIKGGLFVFAGFIASGLLLLECPSFKVAALLAVAIWCFARAYYFAFYVVEHYVDPGYRFAGLASFAKYVWTRRRREDRRVDQPGSAGAPVKQAVGYVALVVKDYDEAIRFYVDTLGFRLVEDVFIKAQQKRWVLIAPPGSAETKVLLARAVGEEQNSRVGNQTGGRVFLFLHTDDFWRDYKTYTSRGVVFVRPPSEETYGTVAVFKDLYGNLWDLLQLKGAGATKPEEAGRKPS